MADDRNSDSDRQPASPREERAREERQGNEGREGFGDDGGARVGRPTPAADQPHRGPSTESVEEGLEGAILNNDDRPARPPTGMGAEAAEGLHGAASDRAEGDVSGVGAVTRENGKDADPEHQGSEPLVHRDATHSSNYGGEMGEPRS